MPWRDLLPKFSHLRIQAITGDRASVTIDLRSTRQAAACTSCQTVSAAGHGWFGRSVQSLPVAGRAVHLRIWARRFRCHNPLCARTTFREDLSSSVLRSQRRTPDVTRILQGLGCEVGGNAGVRLATLLRLRTSRSTLLRVTKRTHLSLRTAPRVVGVDEFAWKKRRRYGTILVDLEVHQVIDLLPDREVTTVAAWFRAHPTILLVTRDRSGAFAEAIHLGAPQALQIADRFHLVMNAATCLEAVVTREHALLRRIRQDLRDQHCPAPVPSARLPNAHQRVSQHRQARRQARYERMLALHQDGWPQSAIARELGMHRDTIARHLKVGHAPQQSNHPTRTKAINRYLAYVWQRWVEGEHNGQRLYHELQVRGYRGGATMVYDAIRPWRHAGARPQHGISARTVPVYSPRQTTWLLLKQGREQPTAEEDAYVHALLQHPSDIVTAFGLIQRFWRLITERDETALGPWTHDAEQSGIAEVVRFVQGLYRDWEAVENALLFRSSQGQVEGSVNRIKLLKRQCYGRASPALLRARVLGARDLYLK